MSSIGDHSARDLEWCSSVDEVERLAERLHGAAEIAIDTEADSLHHYPERLCLVQIADRAGAAYLIDTLAADLAALGRVFANPGTLTVVHAGDNDLAALKRRFAFTFAAVFDTYIAARFLGVTELGLDALLLRYLGVTLGRSRQRDNWAERPLSAEQEVYAVDDVRHLLALKDRLLEELRRLGREEWVAEECAALARLSLPEKAVDPEAYLQVKGAKDLMPRSLAVLAELHVWRESVARASRRPPFKIVGDDVLREIATRRPRDLASLGEIPGCTAHVVGRRGDGILAAVGRAEALADDELPAFPRRPVPRVPGIVRRRIEALRKWRTEAAGRLGLDPGVLLPGRLIERIASIPCPDGDSLRSVEGFRQWRMRELGGEILAVVAPHAG